jgi:uncharacterized protein (TIGR02284 family)
MVENEAVSLLNELVDAAKDGEACFVRALRNCKDPGLKHYFLDRVHSYQALSAELVEHARQLSGEMTDDGTLVGAIRRKWQGLRASLPRSDDVILEQCERTEAESKSAYAEVLDIFLPEQTQKLVQRQYRSIVAHLDRIRQLRNLRRAQARASYISHA